VDERAFWIEFRRWLKARIIADQQMVNAIDQRFGLGDHKQETRRPSPAA
jgi:hypothetical protein